MKSEHRNGCYNRKPFVAHYGGWGLSSKTGEPVQSRIPTVATPDCQYTKSALGQTDPNCAGCKWEGHK